MPSLCQGGAYDSFLISTEVQNITMKTNALMGPAVRGMASSGTGVKPYGGRTRYYRYIPDPKPGELNPAHGDPASCRLQFQTSKHT